MKRIKPCPARSTISLILSFVILFTSNSFVFAEVYYPHTNHQGSVVALTNENGEVVSRNSYYPYGNTLTEEGEQNLQERGYTGQRKDSKVDIYYYNARYYDPSLSSFLSADPTNDQLNRYIYVSGNPINYIDPSGNTWKPTNDIMIDPGGGGAPSTYPFDYWFVKAGGSTVTWSDLSTEEKYIAAAIPFTIAAGGALAYGAYAYPAVATVISVVDTAVDAVSCVFGDGLSCASLAAPPLIDAAFGAVKNVGGKIANLVRRGRGQTQMFDETVSAVRSVGVPVDVMNNQIAWSRAVRDIGGREFFDGYKHTLPDGRSAILVKGENLPINKTSVVGHEYQHVLFDNATVGVFKDPYTQHVESEIFAYSWQASQSWLPNRVRANAQGAVHWFEGMRSLHYSDEAISNIYRNHGFANPFNKIVD